MPLFHFLKRRRTEVLLEDLARRTAGACRKTALERMDAGCTCMSLHELRGYVRGRVGLLVRKQAAEQMKSLPVRPLDAKRVAHLATERLVQAVVREFTTAKWLQTTARKAA